MERREAHMKRERFTCVALEEEDSSDKRTGKSNKFQNRHKIGSSITGPQRICG